MDDPEDGGKHGVVILVGSNGWYNYRHQADACHAYQIIHRNGIPDEEIVVMMYDDITYAEDDPTPGIVIDRPNGTDVYKGVPKDYTGEDVTPQNVLAILRGDAEAVKGTGSGKILKSGPQDHLLVFRNEDLHIKDLNEIIHYMHKHKMYRKMACYYDEKRSVYLGDWYSVNWMEDSDVEDLMKDTLHKQYHLVKSHTNTSHVMQHGNKTISTEKEKEADEHNDLERSRKLTEEIQRRVDSRHLSEKSVRKTVSLLAVFKVEVEQLLTKRALLMGHSCYPEALLHFQAHCFH
ncbi:hypothetical protein P7K49_032016 [Saguinus oedipus]|uniref:Legumain n=1 Tax=Saguinus oedipus TaxID=9490 RepID=A0ABQ9TY02_SAGOE|nr:hypothetical protein P7K49_032016 [Saguinus oedipus]